jgi:hypothetical protein
MNKTSKKCGPSARQQTTTSKVRIESSGYSHSRVILSIVLIAVGIVATSCRQESLGQDKRYVDKETVALRDSLGKPDVNISVNRRYDDKGNLIGFDSIYTLFSADSLHYRWPFRNDLPLKRFDFDDPFLRSMMQRADSIENHFFRDAQKAREPVKKS